SALLSRRPTDAPGGTVPREGTGPDVRILAAATPALTEAVKRGRFDEQLYFRLSALQLDVPPLRERLEDLPTLSRKLLLAQGLRSGRPDLRVSAAGLEKLRAHGWPGNLRELDNVLARAAMSRDTEVLGASALSLIESGRPAASK